MAKTFLPLEPVAIASFPAKTDRIQITDAEGVLYAEAEAGTPLKVAAGGVLGTHRIDYLDAGGRLLKTQTFDVDCQSGIDDAAGRLRAFHDKLYGNFFISHEICSGIFEGKPVAWISPWYRNFAMLIDGAKYYNDGYLSLFEVGAKTQKEDGMIWDSASPCDPEVPYFDGRYQTPGWTGLHPSGSWHYLRLQVECDVEHFYVEGLHAAWTACGDNDWVRPLLDAAAKGLNYLLTDSLRFSQKFQLVRRGATIDTWDFMTDAETKRSGGNVMEAIEGVTNFVILHSDNTGVAHACHLLAEMMEACGEPGAEDWRQKGREILERLDRIAWNGEFYQHWVREDETGALPEPDEVTDESRQVSMGNAYFLNRRGVDADKAAAILDTYQRLAEEVPDQRNREYYFIYPPFFTSFTHCPAWHYSNGGIFPCVGAELAQGAFRHGRENYGLELIDKIHTDLESSNGIFPYYYLGQTYKEPERTFEVLDLRRQANVDFAGEGAPGIPGWTGQGSGNDMSPMPTGNLEYEKIPVHVIDPASNERRACIGLAAREGYADEVEIPVGRKAGCLYFHHTLAGGGPEAGTIEIHYADGSSAEIPVRPRLDVPAWWGPKERPYPGHKPGGYVMKVAWRGWNRRALVGTGLWGLDNPHPDREIASLRLVRSEAPGAFWFVLGITLSDAAHWFPFPDRDKNTVLQTEHAGSTLEALYGGLAGIEDSGKAFDALTLSPRCALDPRLDAGVTFTTRYPLSKGYCRYHWSFDREAGEIRLSVSTSARQARLRVLLPEGKAMQTAEVDGVSLESEMETVVKSRYACLDLKPAGSCRVVIVLSPS